jgi:hypothetical protein
MSVFFGLRHPCLFIRVDDAAVIKAAGRAGPSQEHGTLDGTLVFLPAELNGQEKYEICMYGIRL